MHQIERELLDVTKYKIQRKFSDRQDYLKSIFNAVQKLKNDEFDELTDEAATWANACVESYNRSRDSDLPDFDEVGDEDEDAAGELDSEENGHEDDLDDEEGESEDEVVSGAIDDDAIDDSGNAEDKDQDRQAEPEEAEGDAEDEPEFEKVTPPKKLRKPKPEAKKTKIKKPVDDDEEEVELDKWGCMVGSKNARALALFEKGATAGEVRDELSGTYYNILKRMVAHGHKLEKRGAVIKLTHMTEKSSKVSAPKRSKK